MTTTAKHEPGAEHAAEEDIAFVLEQQLLSLPRNEIREHGMGGEIAYDLVSNELLLDGSARLNLATFVTTKMPPLRGPAHGRDRRQEHDRQGRVPADRGAREALREHHRAPVARARDGDVTGTSTTGSSEAAMLGGMALKWRWRERRRAEGKPTDKPNLVMGINVQVCWDKFCRYWDVEPRLVPMEGDRFHLTADEAVAQCDENTIGVVAILGSTFDGSYEPVQEICAALDELAAGGGPDVPVHVDGGVRRLHRAVRAARPRLGLPAAARAVDQRLGPQVRPRLPGRGLGDLARRGGAAPRPRLRRQLPRRVDADLRAELLAARERGRRPVLHVPRPRGRRLPRSPARLPARRQPHRRGHREARPVLAAHRRQRPSRPRLRPE